MADTELMRIQLGEDDDAEEQIADAEEQQDPLEDQQEAHGPEIVEEEKRDESHELK